MSECVRETEREREPGEALDGEGHEALASTISLRVEVLLRGKTGVLKKEIFDAMFLSA